MKPDIKGGKQYFAAIWGGEGWCYGPKRQALTKQALRIKFGFPHISWSGEVSSHYLHRRFGMYKGKTFCRFSLGIGLKLVKEGNLEFPTQLVVDWRKP
jgi:hypothetical protein